MRTLWVHPGIGKAGSSAIQYAATRLMKADFPITYFQAAPGRHNHHELCRSHHRYDDKLLSQGMHQLSKEKNDCLISSELLGSSSENISAIVDAAMDQFDRIKPIIVVRQPSAWMRSLYSQRIKTAKYFIGESYDDFALRCHYPGFSTVENWGVATKEKPVILKYSNSGLIKKFFGAMGVSVQNTENAETIEFINSSLSQNQLNWLIRYDKEKGKRGDIARLTRTPAEYKRLLADVETDGHTTPVQATAAALRHLDALDDNYSRQLLKWRELGLLSPE